MWCGGREGAGGEDLSKGEMRVAWGCCTKVREPLVTCFILSAKVTYFRIRRERFFFFFILVLGDFSRLTWEPGELSFIEKLKP